MNGQDVFGQLEVRVLYSNAWWLQQSSSIGLARHIGLFSEDQGSISEWDGYKFLLAARLHELVTSIIDFPELLELEADHLILDAWSNAKTEGRASLSDLVARRTDLGTVVNFADTCWVQLRRPNTSVELDSVRKRVFHFAHSITLGIRSSWTTGPKARAEQSLADFRRPALDWLWPFCAEPGFVNSWYRDVFGQIRPARHAPNRIDQWLDDGTPEHRLSEKNEFGTSTSGSVPNGWFRQYSECLKWLLRPQTTGQHRADVDTVRNELSRVTSWSDLFRIARRLRLEPSEKTRSPKKVAKFPARFKRNLLAAISTTAKSESVIWRHGRDLHLVETYGFDAPENFSRILDGLILGLKQPFDKVELARFKHPGGDMSLALKMPAFSNIANYSKWWLFFDVYSETLGPGDGGAEASWRSDFTKVLSDQSDKINLVDFEISKNSLLALADEPGFIWLRNDLNAAKRYVSEVRGVFPEMLVVAMMYANEFHRVKSRVVLPSLRPADLDAIGIRRPQEGLPQIWFVEIKGPGVASNRDVELELGKFHSKVATATSNQQELEEYVGTLGPNYDVRSTFISLARARDNSLLDNPHSIELWGREEFVTALADANVPQDWINLIELRDIALTMDFLSPKSLNQLFDDPDPA